MIEGAHGTGLYPDLGWGRVIVGTWGWSWVLGAHVSMSIRYKHLLVLVPLVLSSMALAQTPVDGAAYPWLVDLDGEQPVTVTLQERFTAPDGFDRVAVTESSFAAWLRGLPVRTDRTQVLSYQGRVLDRPSAGVLLMDVGSRDLMQCADSVIRLHAEYLWSEGRASQAAYRFTSGDLTRWEDWTDGERFVIAGNKVQRRQGDARPADHASFRSWLDLVFTYAGTRSLARDTPAPALSSPVEIGDFYVDPGSPGHAVIVLDIVEDTKGNRLGLIGQGFMPAEEVHVVRSGVAVDGVWFALPDGEHATLNTPSWTPFSASARRRFP